MRGDRITKVASNQTPPMPISLEELKSHLKVDHDVEDALVQSYLAAAVDWAERATNRAILKQTYLIVRDDFPVGAWYLPLGKIDSVTSIEYLDTNGVTQTWAPSPAEHQLDNDSDYQARLNPKTGFTWPSTGEYLSSARVTVVAGWDTNDVPFSIRQALLLKCASLYETRGPGDPEHQPIDDAADMLLSGYKLPGF